jgi:hypothetical protein
MKISESHQCFADHLDDQTALEYPERFLGPNWKDVLNFWIYLDTLSDGDFRLIVERCRALDLDVGARVFDEYSARSAAAVDTIGGEYKTAAWYAHPTLLGACATLELIGSHKILEQNKPLSFLLTHLNL